MEIILLIRFTPFPENKFLISYNQQIDNNMILASYDNNQIFNIVNLISYAIKLYNSQGNVSNVNEESSAKVMESIGMDNKVYLSH